MSNRWFDQFTASYEKAIVHVYFNVTFKGASAPVLNTALSKGVASFTRDAGNPAGSFVITLVDNFYQFMFLNCIPDDTNANPSASTLTACVTTTSGSTVTTGVQQLPGSLRVQFFNSSASLTDPPNNIGYFFDLTVKNSSAF
jgi:hypothetical protein